MFFTITTIHISVITRKLCYRKDDRAMCPIGTLKIFGLPDYAHGTMSDIFMGFCSDQPDEYVPTKFEVRSFTRS